MPPQNCRHRGREASDESNIRVWGEVLCCACRGAYLRRGIFGGWLISMAVFFATAAQACVPHNIYIHYYCICILYSVYNAM